MAPAWLDSLSEDWVSQPRSDEPPAQVPTTPDSRAPSQQGSAREPLSRIPRLCHSHRKHQSPSVVRSTPPRVLSPRSPNENNIRGSPRPRTTSKLSQEIKPSNRGRHPSRSASVSTQGSVLHSTVHHKSHSASPLKDSDSIPEWKRRLLMGEMPYGEAKDLFSSAGTGLENIFRPLAAEDPNSQQPDEVDNEEHTFYETTLPSSPPPYSRTRRVEHAIEETLEEFSEDFSEIKPPPRPTSQTKEVRYRRTDEASAQYSEPEIDDDAVTQGEVERSIGSVKNDGDASRKVSGKSVVLNEDFSPILITRHSNEDGGVSFAPMDLPADQLRKRLDKLQLNQLLLDWDQDFQEEQDSGLRGDGTQASETTEDYGRKGGFLNLRRGGRSAEDSFKHRPLSPPPQTDTSDMLPESSLQASTPKQFPTVRTDRFASAETRDRPSTPLSPDVPPPPNPSPEKLSQAAQSTGGSPLKLFGPYDTFTNQTLLRRISQFEDPVTEAPSRSVDEPKIPNGSPSKSEFNHAFVAGSSPQKGQQVSHGHHEIFGAVNWFGAGELDGFVFSEDISLNSAERSVAADKENIAPTENPAPKSQLIRFEISHCSSASDHEDSIMVRRRRNRSSTIASSSKQSLGGFASRPQSSSQATTAVQVRLGTPKRDSSEGKRPRTSPSKDPTPKRRRTLHRTDIAYGLEGLPAALEAVQSIHHQMQNGIGRKRNNTRQGSELQQVLRPRTPTPSQRSSTQRERYPLADLHLEADETELFERSDFDAHDFAIDGSRKASIKTQDFFDEAERIMAMIRSKARPQAGLASVEESEAEGSDSRKSLTPEERDDSFQDSFKEPFSRPPSREGRPLLRLPTRQDDPELMDKLKQYEEVSDMGDLISYSMRSMGLAKEAIQEANKVNESVEESIRLSEQRHSSLNGQDFISDLPNVRLSRNPDAPASDDRDSFPLHGTQNSNASSGRSVPTGSSRGSDSRRLIAPDVVSQLIGDQVGNMVLDKENNVWMKVKAPRPPLRSLNVLPSEDSEEDPFASIPDLSVDFHKETENLALKTGPLEDLQEYVKEDFPHPPSSGRKSNATKQSMDVLSFLSHTKETLTKMQQSVTDEDVTGKDAEIEHEITIHEDRVQKSSPSRRRNLTITFSSPIASFIQDALPRDLEGDTTEEELSTMEQSIGDIAADSLRRGRDVEMQRPSSAKSNTSSRSRSRSKSSGRGLSSRGQAFIPRPVSRIDEQDEDSTIQDSVQKSGQLSVRGDSSIVIAEERQRHSGLSFVITTPAPTRHPPGFSATPIIAQHVGTLSLSPLSDFTMNHGDQSCALEVSYVVADDYLVTGNRTKKVLSQAIRSLVEKITEVEPFEPDWDAMQTLEINGKQLKSLHKLDEFCGSVVTLDASDNLISHLDGVPQSVRNLKINHNQLSELTPWGHLMNLQYVDVSNNQITSLHAFRNLVHLRNLRADNNYITSLDGIKFHDSLQVLRARGNLITEIDFNGTRLQRLTDLDLEGNEIISIHNLEQLSCLSSLNVENNHLSAFSTTTDDSMTCLKYVKLSNNALTELDLTKFPAIRLLHADRNHLAVFKGFSRARRLDSLSLREQKCDGPLDLSFLSSAYEVRKLFLSGNLLTAFEPRVDFLNLQYLEMANCGLQSLCEGFGQLMPNLRTLNLNFNAIEDLGPLRYIPRLKKILVAGNRLADAKATTRLLAEFPHLSKLDLRDNPVTLGFYPPVQTLVTVHERPGSSSSAEIDPFVMPDASGERDAAFAGRLDMGTRQRRRLYEIVMLQRCARLKVLDGLAADRQRIAERDAVWQALVKSGAIQETPTGELTREQKQEGGCAGSLEDGSVSVSASAGAGAGADA
ncbi:hypothetical protein BX600DRAFT_376440 [Xylariales sp. PMI_506]|nr:hypothetical protein BX600DRAFT_376440 [Xylariales sp. PMI_506]